MNPALLVKSFRHQFLYTLCWKISWFEQLIFIYFFFHRKSALSDSEHVEVKCDRTVFIISCRFLLPFSHSILGVRLQKKITSAHLFKKNLHHSVTIDLTVQKRICIRFKWLVQSFVICVLAVHSAVRTDSHKEHFPVRGHKSSETSNL